MLLAHAIEVVVDIRSIPWSRRVPQFCRTRRDGGPDIPTLPELLARARIAYRHEPRLGGRRSAKDHPGVDPASIDGWNVRAFRDMAGYMQTPAFAAGMDDLIGQAPQARTAIMCSELLWWRCHRRMVADALAARGVGVLHIMPAGAEPHRPTEFAVLGPDGPVTYPAPRR